MEGNTRQNGPPPPIDPGFPDGIEVIDPFKQLADRAARDELLRSGTVEMDENGQLHALRQLEAPKMFVDGADAKAEAESAEPYELDENGNVKSITIEDELGDPRIVDFNANGEATDGSGRLTVQRTPDGNIESFKYTAGNSEHTFDFDSKGDLRYVTSTHPTAEGGSTETRTRYRDGNATRRTTETFNAEDVMTARDWDDGYEHLQQKFDANGNIIEEYSRAPDYYSAMKVHEDGRKQRVSMSSDGTVTENISYPDGRHTFSQQNLNTGETATKETQKDGSSVATVDNAAFNTVTQTDQFGNWIRTVTDKQRGTITETVGTPEGQIGDARESKGA
jgi:hypothetical protein